MEHAISTPQAATLKISFRFLLGLYLILPVFFVMFLIDQFAPTPMQMPREGYLYLALFFGTPHIVASNFILVTNKEYLSLYKWRLLGATVAIILFFAIGRNFFSFYELSAMVGIVDVLHTAKQQLGIGNILGRLSGPVYQFWLRSALGACALMNYDILIGYVLTPFQHQIKNYVLIALCTVTVMCALVLSVRLKAPMARTFFWANTGLALMSIFFYSQGYFLFAIFSSRIIHDVTAFAFYIVHDHNKHGRSAKNLVYRILSRGKITAIIAVPVIALFVSFVLRLRADLWMTSFANAFHFTVPEQAFAAGFVTYISLMHFFTEAFTWKGESPYRKHISFSLPAAPAP